MRITMAAPKIRHVKQRTPSSCGLACVAMLTGSGIGEIRRAIGPSVYRDETEVSDIRRGLRRLGFRLGRAVYTRSWRRLFRRLKRGLVAVRLRRLKDGSEVWHWVVFEQEDERRSVWDPARSPATGRRVDYQNLPLAWYHRVV